MPYVSVAFIVVWQKLVVYFCSQFECTVHYGKEAMAARASSSCHIASAVKNRERWRLEIGFLAFSSAWDSSNRILQPICLDGFSYLTSVKLIKKLPHRDTQRHIFEVILNPVPVRKPNFQMIIALGEVYWPGAQVKAQSMKLCFIIQVDMLNGHKNAKERSREWIPGYFPLTAIICRHGIY